MPGKIDNDVQLLVDESFVNRIKRMRGKISLKEELKSLSFGFQKILLELLAIDKLVYKSPEKQVVLCHKYLEVKTNHTLDEFLDAVHAGDFIFDIASFRLNVMPIEMLRHCQHFDDQGEVSIITDKRYDETLRHRGVTLGGARLIENELRKVFTDWNGAYCQKLDRITFEISTQKKVLVHKRVWAKFKILEVNKIKLLDSGFTHLKCCNF